MSLIWDGSQPVPVSDGCMHLTRTHLERLVVEQGPDPELSAIQVHLQECQACQTELSAKLHEEEAAGNRQINSTARIKILNPITSNGPSAPAYLLTASPRSLHIRVSRLMFVGTRVHVRSPLGQGFGSVRYCIPAGSEFQIGVRLETAG
jgi:hypothetical protein